ncbi:MAG: nucleotidyl transferase AbiEii/AbiGii toxin family protein [Solirubrobacterales bacterium]
MVPKAFVRQYAVSQQIDVPVADQEIVLHYALALLNEIDLVGVREDGGNPGPLLFKGGTALRKCVFGSTGRFSQDIDLDATAQHSYEEAIEEAVSSRRPYHGIAFKLDSFRYSTDGNFSGTIGYEHADGSGHFELQISYRLDPILEPVRLDLATQTYFKHVECGVPVLFGIDPYEMIGEKIMACNRRGFGGSGKDVYDLFLWSQRPFDDRLVRRLAALKAWTDQRSKRRYDPEQFLAGIVPKSFRWTDIARLVPRRHGTDHEAICSTVQARFGFLADGTEDEQTLVEDQTAHREHRLFGALRREAHTWAGMVPR